MEDSSGWARPNPQMIMTRCARTNELWERDAYINSVRGVRFYSAVACDLVGAPPQQGPNVVSLAGGDHAQSGEGGEGAP